MGMILLSQALYLQFLILTSFYYQLIAISKSIWIFLFLSINSKTIRKIYNQLIVLIFTVIFITNSATPVFEPAFCDASFTGTKTNQATILSTPIVNATSTFLASGQIAGDITGSTFSVIYRKSGIKVLIQVYSDTLVIKSIEQGLPVNDMVFIDGAQQYALFKEVDAATSLTASYKLFQVFSNLTYKVHTIDSNLNDLGQNISAMIIYQIADLDTDRNVVVTMYGNIGTQLKVKISRINTVTGKLVQMFDGGWGVGAPTGCNANIMYESTQGVFLINNVWTNINKFSGINVASQTVSIVPLAGLYFQIQALSSDKLNLKGVLYSKAATTYGFNAAIKLTATTAWKRFTDEYFFYCSAAPSELLLTMVTYSSSTYNTFSYAVSANPSVSVDHKPLILADFSSALKVSHANAILYVLTGGKMNIFKVDTTTKIISKQSQIVLAQDLSTLVSQSTNQQIKITFSCMCIQKEIMDMICSPASFSCIAVTQNSQTDCTK